MNIISGTILVNADDYYDLKHKLIEAEKTIADLQCDLKKEKLYRNIEPVERFYSQLFYEYEHAKKRKQPFFVIDTAGRIHDRLCDEYACMNDSKEVVTVFDKIKSLTPIELARQDWIDCPFNKCDKDIINMSNAEADATCVKCIHEWLLSEYKESE